MKNTALFVFILWAHAGFSQIQFTAGTPHTATTPSGSPGSVGSRTRFDLTTGRVYMWNTTSSSWTLVAQGVDNITGCLAPAYTPGYAQSEFAINACDSLYRYRSGQWRHLNPPGGGGGGGTVSSDATIDGDGSGGSPLKIAQQSAVTPKVLSWTGTTWEPSWGNPYTFVTSGSTITTAVNEVLIGTLSANITIGLPSCNSTNDTKHFKFIRNGSDAFSVTIDPSSTEAFYDGATTKIIYGKIAIDCTCRFSGGTGVWFVDNL